MGTKDKSSYKSWEGLAQKELGGKSLEELSRSTIEGIPTQPLYTSVGAESDGTYPGIHPFQRGIYGTMYTNRPWTLRQYAGFSTAEESNAFYKESLAHGQTGLSVAFDLPTHRGYDSDNPRISGDVGNAGVAIDTVEDMKRLFDGIPLDKVSVSMTMNGAVLPILACFIVAAEEQGVSQDKLMGTIQNDILKEFLVRNTYIYPPGPSMTIVADVIAYLANHCPKFNSISVSGYHMLEAGATIVQELAFTIADGIEYVRTALNKGLKIDEFAPQLSFFFGIGMNFFMEIAKLRAARVLWAQHMESYQPENPKSKMLRLHCQTSGVSLTAQSPYNNIIRTTLEALSAVLGGTQSLHTNSFDEALALPTSLSANIARNTQHILRDETGISHVIDPLGGSYYVENLTQELIDRASTLIKKIEEMGGMTKAIEKGFPQGEIEKAAVERQARFEKGEETVVGVNAFVVEEADAPEIRRVETLAVQEIQVKRLKETRAKRDIAACEKALENLKDVAKSGDGNLLEATIKAMRLRATVGEVSKVLSDVFTRYEPSAGVVEGTYEAEYKNDPHFKEIQLNVRNLKTKRGHYPRVLLAKMGQDGHDRGLKVIATALSDLGFDVTLVPMFQTPGEIAALAVEKGIDVVGISSQVAGHRVMVPELLRELETGGGKDMGVICGGIIPSEDQEILKKLGVFAIFEPNTSILEAADVILKYLGMRFTPQTG
ncbi:MAG: methylmalonyl-CoA mutase [Alphaproteobacteria bacterium]|jgi:methylmalonyl-CoA mutase|nr:methylmalonyl-CoA mutase [Alphaproteobacteria bacterium]MBT5389547.1 methylmalonyl-CoA mutase [Alphaproteobacteria bacterium]